MYNKPYLGLFVGSRYKVSKNKRSDVVDKVL
jgi:hypothetical protein